MIASQTWAMLVDSYRELNARKLFWITLGLSLLVVLAFAAVGINEKGMTILWWTLDIPSVNTTVFSRADFYKMTFTGLGVGIWLTWIAAILALVSTASMIPDMLASGSIELVLARPISRARLFLTKYFAGLLFVVLQVLVFCLASFLVIGLRGGVWEPGLFLAVPIVTLFFSYLFGLCVLFGVLTRSAIASLLMTLLVWFLTFALNSTEVILLMQKTGAEMSIDRHAIVVEDTGTKVDELQAQLDGMEAQAASGEIAEDDPKLAQLRVRVDAGTRYMERLTEGEAKSHRSLKASAKWHRMIFGVKSFLPKTSETTELLNRWLVDLANLPKPEESGPSTDKDLATFLGTPANEADASQSRMPRSVTPTPEEIQYKMQEIIRSRSVAWVIGTSLAFEAFCVGLAMFLFSRRDF